jgi:ferrous iron transport protein B
MWLMFFCTFNLGKYPKQGIESLVKTFSDYVGASIGHPVWSDFLSHGVIDGVGSVLAFLPNIFIMFFFIALYEMTGYGQRSALLMDKLMHGIGLHGSSFIPLLMGFGCNVPAILATKTVKRRSDRLVTMLMIPFMSCSARLPAYILLIGTFFPDNPLTILMLLYVSGIILAIVTAFIINKLIFKPEPDFSEIYFCELRQPAFKSVVKFMWNASAEYLKKIGTVVLLAVIIIWLLDYFPREKTETRVENIAANQIDFEQDTTIHLSYLSQVGYFIAPVMKPLGFDWKMSVSLLAGLPAKEFIVGTMAVVYNTRHDAEDNDIQARLRNETYEDGTPVFNKAVALSFLFFALLYMPCIGVLVSIRKESGSLKWAFFTFAYTTSLAWTVAFLVYRAALLIF